MRIAFCCCLLLVLLAAVVLVVAQEGGNKNIASIYSGIIIEDLDRTIDVSKGSFARHAIRLTISNAGSTPATSFFVAFKKDQTLSYVGAESNNQKLSVTADLESKLERDAVFYEIKLPKTLEPRGPSVTVKLTIVQVNVVSALPKTIRQRENQKLLYVDNVYFFSPYAAKSQRTTVQLGSSVVESYNSDVRPTEKRSDSIVYGPYSDVKAFSQATLRVHWQNNNPFVVINKCERIIEISHWGNLAIEEHYEIVHGGAKLKGSFSRLDYTRGPQQTSPSSWRSLVAVLPKSASDIYYRDRIGNISTSAVREAGNNLEVEFLPRYPMFGGWKTTFYIGYNLPLSEFMTVSGSKHTLRTSFSVPFDFAPVLDLTVKVIVPEGATDIDLQIPFSVDRSTETIKTYLDTFGRTVLVAKKKNVAPEHNQPFTVSYYFAASSLLHEPLLVIGGLFAFCVAVMAAVRFDLTIAKSSTDIAKENEGRIAEIVELYTDKQLERDALYSHLESHLTHFIKGGRIADELSALKAKRQGIKEYVANSIIAELNKMDAKDVASKVGQIESVDDSKLAVLESIIKERKSDKSDKKAVAALEQEYDNKTDTIVDLLDDLQA